MRCYVTLGGHKVHNIKGIVGGGGHSSLHTKQPIQSRLQQKASYLGDPAICRLVTPGSLSIFDAIEGSRGTQKAPDLAEPIFD